MADSSKTEKATPKKREDERKKGNIFQSSDVVSAFSILAIFVVLKLVFPFSFNYMSNVLVKYIGCLKTVQTLSVGFSVDVIKDFLMTVVIIAGPVMMTSAVVSIIATGVQTKFKFSKEQLKIKFSRMSPLQGFKKLFSLRSITELIKSIIKIAIIIYILYSSFKDISGYFVNLMFEDVAQGMYFILDSIMGIVLKLSIVFILIAAFDYLYQWWDYERNIKMTKQEVKEEYKQLEGDPQIKGQIKERQRKMATNRMMQQVPSADVIVRNPTHIAIALKYNIEKNNAPIVVAKGQDQVALKIIEIAKKNNVPMTENKPLARALYKTVDLNREIPEQYYVIIAEIMAWVYSQKKEMKRY